MDQTKIKDIFIVITVLVFLILCGVLLYKGFNYVSKNEDNNESDIIN